MTPKEFLTSYVKKFNGVDISSLISMYELDACFVSQEGEVVKGDRKCPSTSTESYQYEWQDRIESNWSGSDQRYRSCKY